MAIDAPLGFALAAGTVAAFNPCGFAMLPAYLTFFLGGTDPHRARQRNPVARALAVAGAMTLGFVAVFGIAGLAIEGASLTVGRWAPWFTLVIGAAMVPLGVAMVAGRTVKVRLPRLQRGGGDAGLASMALFGASYATVSLSCTLPVFLAAVTGSFRAGDVAGGLAAYVAYALGMGLVIAVLTVALALARDGAVRRLRRVRAHVDRVAGVLLILTGAYVTYYAYFELRLLRGDAVAAGPVDWVTRWSADLSRLLDDLGALPPLVSLAVLTGAGLLVQRHRRARVAPNDDPDRDNPSTTEKTDQPWATYGDDLRPSSPPPRSRSPRVGEPTPPRRRALLRRPARTPT